MAIVDRAEDLEAPVPQRDWGGGGGGGGGGGKEVVKFSSF